jgi:hypothetical protein
VAKGRWEGIPTAKLSPMDEGDLRKLANGCLDESPYPADVGPLCFRPEGRAIRYGGWGNAEGRYEVVGNKIVISRRNYATGENLESYSLSFYRDQAGRPYYRYNRAGVPDVAFLLRMAEQ